MVTIDRPDVRNAVDVPTARALAAAFRRFESDAAADVAVLTGAGGTFCAGADLKAVAGGETRDFSAEADGPMGPTRMQLEKPVIAAIEGHAVAGGLELALWCDLRVVAEDAVLGVFCRRFGVPLIDLGTIRSAATHRAQPRDGSDSHRPPRPRKRSCMDGSRQSSRAEPARRSMRRSSSLVKSQVTRSGACVATDALRSSNGRCPRAMRCETSSRSASRPSEAARH